MISRCYVDEAERSPLAQSTLNPPSSLLPLWPGCQIGTGVQKPIATVQRRQRRSLPPTVAVTETVDSATTARADHAVDSELQAAGME